jgi:hypothetical protein
MTAPNHDRVVAIFVISLAGGRESGWLAGCWPRDMRQDVLTPKPIPSPSVALVLIPYYQSQGELQEVKIVQNKRP